MPMSSVGLPASASFSSGARLHPFRGVTAQPIESERVRTKPPPISSPCLALGERFGSQDELKERYGVAKSTMSDRLTEWEHSGLVPTRTSRGVARHSHRN